MQELFLKTVRWLIVVLFIIAGIGALNLADQSNSIKPVLPGLLCLGMAFVLGTAWKDLRRKILFITLALTVMLGFAAKSFESILYVLTGDVYIVNFFVGWAALCTVIGFPLMMLIFHKFSD